MKYLLNGVVFATTLFGLQAAFGLEVPLSTVFIVLGASILGDIAEGVYAKINETETEN